MRRATIQQNHSATKRNQLDRFHNFVNRISAPATCRVISECSRRGATLEISQTHSVWSPRRYLCVLKGPRKLSSSSAVLSGRIRATIFPGTLCRANFRCRSATKRLFVRRSAFIKTALARAPHTGMFSRPNQALISNFLFTPAVIRVSLSRHHESRIFSPTTARLRRGHRQSG